MEKYMETTIGFRVSEEWKRNGNYYRVYSGFGGMEKKMGTTIGFGV